MKLDLGAIRSEIQEYLESRGIVVFHGYSVARGEAPAVYWDTDGHPDYRAFLAAAEAAGAKLVTIHTQEFTEEMIEDAVEQLETTGLSRDEHRAIEQRLREMRGYLGFTCQIELSFDLGARVYVFDLRTEWFDDFSEMLERIEDAYGEDDEEDEGSMGSGYFSKN